MPLTPLRILILGSHGGLGKALTRRLEGIGEITAWSRADLDLSQLDLIAPKLEAQPFDVLLNPAGMTSLGSNMLQATAASGEPLNLRPGEQGAGTLAQGFLESANVKAVEEMIDMISTQRAYELNSKVIQTADQMLQRLTSMR